MEASQREISQPYKENALLFLAPPPTHKKTTKIMQPGAEGLGGQLVWGGHLLPFLCPQEGLEIFQFHAREFHKKVGGAC